MFALAIISFVILWLIFINVMTWKKHKEKIPKLIHYPLYVIAAIGYVIDILFNWVYGTIIFLELPRQLTLSERLREALIKDDSWRFKLAYFFCTKLIEPWDWNHCEIQDLKK